MMKLPLVKEKAFYTSLLFIAVPIALQNLISFSLNMIDNVMVGSLGTVEISAVSLANQPFFVFSMLIFGIGGGASALISQYWGKGDTVAINKVSGITLSITVGAGFLLLAAALLIPETLIRFYTSDPDVIALGVDYLRYAAFTFPIFGVSSTMVSILRSVESVRVALISSIISCAVNTVGNYLLIYGNLGFPKMGVAGSSLATLIARLVDFAVMVIYLAFFEKNINLKFSQMFRFNRLLLRDFFVISMPVAFNEIAWSVGVSVQSAVFGHIGSDAVSARSITDTVSRFPFLAILGVGNATAVIIAKTIGQGEKEKVKEYTKTILLINLLFGVVGGGLMFCIKAPVLSLFNLTSEAHILADQMLSITAATTFLNALNFTIIVGLLRGGGDTTYSLVIDVAFLWAVSVPLSYFLGIVIGISASYLTLAMTIEGVLKVIFGLYRIRSWKWIKSVTREFAA